MFFKVQKLLIVVFSILLTLLPLQAFAIANPTSTSIADVAVFSDVSVPGDQLFYVRYNVNYATVPSEPASTSFLMAIYDTDGTTLLAQRALNYYQENIISIYLSPTLALATGGAYVVRIMGNPGMFPLLVEGVNKATSTLAAGNYQAGTNLGGYLLTQAQILETDWSITLLTASGLLNTTGTVYFVKAIPGLTDIVPEIFQVSTSYPGVGAPSTNTTYSTTLLNHRGTNMDVMISEWATWLGTSKSWISLGFTGFVMVLLMSVVFAGSQNPGWAIGIGVIWLPLATWMGLLELTVFLLILGIVFLLFGFIFIMGKMF